MKFDYCINDFLCNKALTIVLGFILMFHTSIFSQNQKLTDSLEIIFSEGNFNPKHKLNLLRDLSVQHPNTGKKLAYCNQLLALAKALDSTQYLFTAYLEKGNALYQKGDLSLAIESYIEAGDIAFKNKNNKDLGMILASIASAYLTMENEKMAIKYYKRAIDINKNVKDTKTLATSIMNLGYTYVTLNKPDSAMIYFEESGALFEQINFKVGMAYNLANKGLAHAQLKNFQKAELDINNAIESIQKYGHHRAISELLIQSSEIYLMNNNVDLALDIANRGLDLAIEHNLKPQIRDANLQLSKIYEITEIKSPSLEYYKNHIIYKDSVKNLSSIQDIANMQTEFEVSQKQAEIELKEAEVILLNEQKTNQKVLILVMVVVLGMTGLYYWKINKEKRKSDDLLLNILPSETAEELKKNGMVKAKKFDSVTVMFTDFQAFTRYSHKLSPEVLVKSVDYYFSKFDDIIEKHSLEKIKTIGDAYMCAGGLNSESPDHYLKIIRAAFQISEFVKKSKDSELGELAHFDIRIGINTGPVVAGVVGKKKFAYDIWGDSVNVASRMESCSEPGRINISENTYQLIKNKFNCVYRGEIEVKNKGLMKMYFVEGNKAISVFNDSPKIDKFKAIRKTKTTV